MREDPKGVVAAGALEHGRQRAVIDAAAAVGGELDQLAPRSLAAADRGVVHCAHVLGLDHRAAAARRGGDGPDPGIDVPEILVVADAEAVGHAGGIGIAVLAIGSNIFLHELGAVGVVELDPVIAGYDVAELVGAVAVGGGGRDDGARGVQQDHPGPGDSGVPSVGGGIPFGVGVVRIGIEAATDRAEFQLRTGAEAGIIHPAGADIAFLADRQLGARAGHAIGGIEGVIGARRAFLLDLDQHVAAAVLVGDPEGAFGVDLPAIADSGALGADRRRLAGAVIGIFIAAGIARQAAIIVAHRQVAVGIGGHLEGGAATDPARRELRRAERRKSVGAVAAGIISHLSVPRLAPCRAV